MCKGNIVLFTDLFIVTKLNPVTPDCSRFETPLLWNRWNDFQCRDDSSMVARDQTITEDTLLDAFEF